MSSVGVFKILGERERKKKMNEWKPSVNRNRTDSNVIPEHAKQLIDFWIALKQWFPRGHFGKYATNWPNIHVARIALWTEQNFGGSIPQCHNFMCVDSNRDAKSTAQTKISNLFKRRNGSIILCNLKLSEFLLLLLEYHQNYYLNDAITIDEQILWF